MLKTIREILSPKKPTGNPYNLKDSEFAALKELRTHPHWDVYTDFLDKLCKLLAEDMFQASEDRTVVYYRSYISGLRRAGTIVDEIINHERTKDVRDRTRRAERSQRTQSKRDLATFGTDWHTT